MIKRILSLAMAIFIMILIPVRSYAAAAGAGIIIGGTAYAAGTYTFGTLPPVVQGIMNSAAEDYQSQLFPSRSSIILLDPKSQVGGGGNNNNNKQPVTPPTLYALVTTLILEATYQIVEHGEEAWELVCSWADDISSAFENEPSTAELELGKYIVQQSVDQVNQSDFGNAPLSCGRFIELEKDNVFRMLDEAGLIDEGTSIFSSLKEQYGFDDAYSIRYDQINFTDGYINNKPGRIIIATPNADFTQLQLITAIDCMNWVDPFYRYSYDSSSDSIRYCAINSPATTYPRYSGYHAEIVYYFVYTASTGQEALDKSSPFYRDLQQNKVPIVDGDLESIPGINAPIESDIEKAAKALADQLGVDISRILDEYKVTIDENGERYLTSAAGISTAINDLVKAYNESIAGNTAIIDSLQNLLDQLKSQDISGIESIVSQIQSNIDDLNNRDKNREAVYSNITETLSQVKTQLEKNYIDPEIINDINSNIETISSVISPLSDPFKIDQDKLKSPAIITTKFPFSLPFDLYRILTLFVRTPEKPIFTIPINTSLDSFGLDYQVDEELVLDLTMFKIGDVDIVQVVLNFSCIVGFIIMLIKITTKLFV